jgi:hypothetical protein
MMEPNRLLKSWRFEDTWEWNTDAEKSYEETVERGGSGAHADSQVLIVLCSEGRSGVSIIGF